MVQEQHVTTNNTSVNIGPDAFFIAFVMLLGVLVLGYFVCVTVLARLKERRAKEATTMIVSKAAV